MFKRIAVLGAIMAAATIPVLTPTTASASTGGNCTVMGNVLGSHVFIEVHSDNQYVVNVACRVETSYFRKIGFTAMWRAIPISTIASPASQAKLLICTRRLSGGRARLYGNRYDSMTMSFAHGFCS